MSFRVLYKRLPRARCCFVRHHLRQPLLTARHLYSSKSLASAAAAAASTNAAYDGGASTIHPRPHHQPPTTEFKRKPIQPHHISPQLSVPPHIDAPPYAATGHVPTALFEKVLIHNSYSIEKMKTAARLARKILDLACTLAQPGITTDAIDKQVHEAIVKHDAYPSPLNYHGFPKSLCSSVNEVICHGIPDARPLQDGDVVSFDVSCFIGGVHGDNCATVIVGDVGNNNSDQQQVDWRGIPVRTTFTSPEQEEHFRLARRLVQATRESLYAAIDECKPGACLTQVGRAIHEVADSYGYDTVQKYRGHGISSTFHGPPYVKHYRNHDHMELQPGMVFTIEPMLTQFGSNCTEWDDDWTVVTVDGGLAAQFEHTVLITDTGVEILTLPE